MTVKEFYEKIGGNYEEVCSRLMKEERVLKYLNKFLASDNYQNLHARLNEKDFPEAFREVHSLKGVALNLALTPLAEASSVLCEELRSGQEPKNDISAMLSEVDRRYKETVEGINELISEN